MGFIDHIGTDESGKGDFFGPLVIAGVFVNAGSVKTLEELKIRDSKKISDNVILKLEKEIKSICPSSVVAIGPEKYNELYSKMQNLNKLLAWGHARAIENILASVDCEMALTDQFGDERLVQQALMKKGKKIRLLQRPKAEEDIAVAAASVLARAEFLRRLNQLSEKFGVKLPKGASPTVIQAGKELVTLKGENILSKTAKLHFKTTKQVLEII